MAEMGMGKGVTAGKLASNVQKKLTRAQEKVMQKLGKADETRDVAFEEGVINFNKQYTEGSKLQKDLRAYLAAVQTMHESSKNLQECLSDMYEPEWYGKDDVDSIVEDTDVLWTDFHQKLVDNALISMDTYLGQFPDIKSRIAKRDRKLVDYDSARHNHSSTNKGKKGKDGGIKITKPASLLERATPGWAQGILSAHNIAQSNLSRNQAEDELERAQKVFEEINEDLQEELPSLWNSRVGFYVSTFQSMAGFEEKFHKEMGKLDQNLYDVLVKLERQDMSGELPRGADPANHALSPGGPPPIPKSPSKLRPAMPPRPESSPCRDMKPENIINLFDAAAAPGISVTSPTQAVSWDTWEPEEAPAPPEEPKGWDDDGTLPVRAAGWDDDGTLPVRAAGCGDDGTLPVRAAGWDDDGTLPVRAAGWDDDGTLSVRAAGCGDDGIAAATAGWDDDGSLPTASAAAAESEAAGWDNEEGVPQPDTPAASTPAASTPASSTPASAAPEETHAVAAAATNGDSEAVEMPPGFLFKVTTMHDYAANDSDELEMKAGDIVLVVAFDNPEEQDEGWLMGMKEEDWIQNKQSALKGVFPENFTSRL
ncbi:myc box-dependent-interacting protein 1 isoform X2 [Coregonus clupeaformis]|uniref:myc box-dependent-interacting protein 1 isoform X2 n=1 Tax=Coregonus clupeaformis TaxID=59861 RepID=UPI001BDF98CE|nr:myc box-dependent-interacting protein 1 isoform X2 [Coregonus clupeaformis]